MSRVIDADKLHYHKAIINAMNWTHKEAVVVFAKDIDKAEIIDAVPVAECKKCAEKTHDCIIKLQKQIEQLKHNTVEVVRCYECENSIAEEQGYIWCKLREPHPRDWFCADGKPKKEGNK